MRGVAILLSILIPLASCGMDAFSQEVDRVAEPFPVTAGEHELSVKLASRPAQIKPGSSHFFHLHTWTPA